MKIPVSLITDADPTDASGNGDVSALYPDLGDLITVSANTAKMKEREDKFVKVYHGVKTLEYDLALYDVNRLAMIKALKELHPKIAKTLESTVKAGQTDAEKARLLFSGMFERTQNNVQKGRFGQALAQIFAEGAECTVPVYITEAIKHACRKELITP